MLGSGIFDAVGASIEKISWEIWKRNGTVALPSHEASASPMQFPWVSHSFLTFKAPPSGETDSVVEWSSGQSYEPSGIVESDSNMPCRRMAGHPYWRGKPCLAKLAKGFRPTQPPSSTNSPPRRCHPREMKLHIPSSNTYRRLSCPKSCQCRHDSHGQVYVHKSAREQSKVADGPTSAQTTLPALAHVQDTEDHMPSGCLTHIRHTRRLGVSKFQN